MATNQAVWGIEIGQAGLKAIRLRYAEAAGKMVAVAFDFIPHAKILNQPDAIPDELIREALKTFLSRNTIGSDLIAIGLPGHSALARFIQLPPVAQDKVAEIVKYEARQQIPFPLDEVIWDYQPMGAGSFEGDLLLDAEVGLFAMKRTQVLQNLKPFQEENLEIELIQISPLALHNFLSFDQMGIKQSLEKTKKGKKGEEEAPPKKQHEHVLVIDMGTDNTTLMVSDGEKIWIRNVPIGGNHFTRALTKSMKLTFAKAEHLKCNATKAPDPRAVFQALKPVFNEYVSEIQKSIGFFASVNREAKISRVLGVGNGFKLAGLQKFLQQNLQYPVERLDSFRELAGDAVINAPLFRENVMSFAVAYGLAIQAAGQTEIKTTLLPPEIIQTRMIRRKKPWAVVTAAVLLLGLFLSIFGEARTNGSVSDYRFGDALKEQKNLAQKVTKYTSQYNGAVGAFKSEHDKGEGLIKGIEDETWLEFYKVINECTRVVNDENLFVKPKNPNPEDLHQSHTIYINSMTLERESSPQNWFEGLPKNMKKSYMRKTDRKNPPEEPGYIFTITGFHTHYNPQNPLHEERENYVRDTILRNLKRWEMPGVEGVKKHPVRKMGISHAILTNFKHGNIKIRKTGLNIPRSSIDVLKKNPKASSGTPGEGPLSGTDEPGSFERAPESSVNELGGNRDQAAQYDTYKQTAFEIQVYWKYIPPADRLKEEPETEETDDEDEEDE